MFRKLNDDGSVIITIFIVIYLIIICLLIFSVIQMNENTDVVVLEGVVVDVIYDNNFNYMVIEMDDGEQYKLSVINKEFDSFQYYDFTYNSKVLIRMHKTHWWMHPNEENIYNLDEIVKVS